MSNCFLMPRRLLMLHESAREWLVAYLSAALAAAAGSIFRRVSRAALLTAWSLSAQARLSSGIADLATAVYEGPV